MAKKENETAAQGQQSEKLKALKAAMEKIEKDFGKGSIMKLGEERIDNIQVIPTGSIALDYALGVAVTQGDESLRYMALSLQVRRLWLFMLLLRLRSKAASLLSSTLNMPSTASMLPTSA